eukprot:6781145-Alexandrium_andersonii.AAC.1
MTTGQRAAGRAAPTSRLDARATTRARDEASQQPSPLPAPKGGCSPFLPPGLLAEQKLRVVDPG